MVARYRTRYGFDEQWAGGYPISVLSQSKGEDGPVQHRQGRAPNQDAVAVLGDRGLRLQAYS